MDADLLREFLTESFEGLEQLDNDIVALEKDPTSGDLLPAIFRTIHTIKGGCGFMNFQRLESLAHATETVLGKLRDRQLTASSDVISDVLRGIDLIKALLQGLEQTGNEPQIDTSDAIERLNMIASGMSPERSQASAAGNTSASPSESDPYGSRPSPSGTHSDSDHQLTGAKVHESKSNSGSLAGRRSSVDGLVSGADLTVRISTSVLDELMNLVGELVLTRNELLQLSRHDQESQYYNPISQLNRVTSELQEGIMKTRMQPISTVWGKLPRMVRELSKSTGKPLELTLHGESTELDRTVLEAIRDPLTHMLRNSADHGIEPPDERVAHGKTRHGNISLSAFHEAGQVIIEVRDDGGGIDREKVVKRAIERGLITQAAANLMSDHDISQFIFEPGFSTADQISNLSGRGVGTDVVKTAVEAIGGSVEVFSQRGKGTTFKVRIPLTLAIISALLVESGDRTFAIPQVGILELVALNGLKDERLAWLQDRAFFRRRDRMLPLLKLSDALGLSDQPFSKTDTLPDESTIVVVQVGHQHIGLVVDRVLDTEEIVVKPVGASVQSEGLYQGATILGDGQVIMILDAESLVRQEGIDLSVLPDGDTLARDCSTSAAATSRVLIVEDGKKNEIGIALAQVARLEEFEVDSIITSGEMPAVSYRGDILPLVPLASHCVKESGVQPVVVFSDEDSAIGLMVSPIVDIKDAEVELRFLSKNEGFLGSALLNDKIVELLDPEYYLSNSVKRIDRKPVVMVVSENELETRLLCELGAKLEYPLKPFGDVKDAIAFLECGRRTAGVLCSVGRDNLPWRTWWSELTYRRGNRQLAAAVTGIAENLPNDIARMLSLADIPVTGSDVEWLFSALQQQWCEMSPQGAAHYSGSLVDSGSVTHTNIDQFVSFTVSGHHFGLPVINVQEVLIAGGISAVPHLAQDVQGLLNLRGQIVTAVNLRQRLQLETRREECTANVVVQAPWGAFGLLVDSVGDVVEIPVSSREVVPCTLRPSLRRFANGVARVENQLVTLLDTQKLLNLSAA